MSDAPPAKPKGSLRDRIAMFEQTPSAPAAAPVPSAPRGKLGAWKPKPVERDPVAANDALNIPKADIPRAVEEPASGSDDTSSIKRSSGAVGMSAADARSSISKGGGLSMKERMAALAGAGAFGGPASAPPPIPTATKPVVKRLPISSPALEEVLAAGAAHEQPDEPPAAADDAAEEHGVTDSAADEEEAPVEKSEEELERERRAAIAARMARLGGTRVGMAPVFGRPSVPTATKPTRKVSQDTAVPHSAPTPATHDQATTAKPVDEHADEGSSHVSTAPTHIELPQRKLTASDIALPPSAAISPPTTGGPLSPPLDDAKSAQVSSPPTSTPATSPPAMPIPAAPRRARPPRKKVSKPDPPKQEPPTPATEVLDSEASSPTRATAADIETKTDETETLPVPRPSLDPDAPPASDLSTVTVSHLAVVESANSIEAEHASNLVDVRTDKPDDGSYEATSSPTVESRAAAGLVDVQSDQQVPGEGEDSADELSAAEEVKLAAEKSFEAETEHASHTEPFTAHAVPAKDVLAIPEEKEYLQDIVEPDAFDEVPVDRAAGVSPSTAAVEPVVAEVVADEGDEDDAARRRRIAEKLAKKGGRNIFNAAPAQTAPAHATESSDEPANPEETTDAHDDGGEEDEDDAARRARIAERLARQGGRNAFAPPIPSAPRPTSRKATAESNEIEVQVSAPLPTQPTIEVHPATKAVKKEDYDDDDDVGGA